MPRIDDESQIPDRGGHRQHTNPRNAVEVPGASPEGFKGEPDAPHLKDDSLAGGGMQPSRGKGAVGDRRAIKLKSEAVAAILQAFMHPSGYADVGGFSAANVGDNKVCLSIPNPPEHGGHRREIVEVPASFTLVSTRDH